MAPRRSKLDTEIQRLYGLPFGEFTAARNQLAKELKKQGDKDASEEVASLPKPSVSAWAVKSRSIFDHRLPFTTSPWTSKAARCRLGVPASQCTPPVFGSISRHLSLGSGTVWSK